MALDVISYSLANSVKADNTNLIINISNYTTVAAVANTYTLNLTAGKNFAITTADANAKTIAFSNVPATANTIIQISIFLTYTNAAAITHPAGVSWLYGIIPTFTAGKKYQLLYTSYDNGVSWLAATVGWW